jgi:hypothetical protein
MITKRKIIYVIVLVFVLVPILIFFLVPKGPQPSIVPDGQVNPTSVGRPSVSGAPLDVNIISIFPEENQNTEFLPIQQIEITFSNFIDASNLDIEVIPQASIKVGNSQSKQNTIIISPDPVWETGTTTIRVARTTLSGKQILNTDLVYTIKTNYPKNPPDVH